MSEPTGYGPDYYKSESDLRKELAASRKWNQDLLDAARETRPDDDRRAAEWGLAVFADLKKTQKELAEAKAALNAMWLMTEAEASLKSHALKGMFDDFSCSKEHVTVQSPCVEPRPVQTSDLTMFMECLGLLHRFALEQTGWRGFFGRWYYSDEPLRHDAANLVRRAEYTAKQPECTKLVGEGR